MGPVLARRPSFAIRSQDDSCSAAQANDRIGSEWWGAHAAPVQTKDSNGAENECDPVQYDARKASQGHAIHDSQTPSIGRALRPRTDHDPNMGSFTNGRQSAASL